MTTRHVWDICEGVRIPAIPAHLPQFRPRPEEGQRFHSTSSLRLRWLPVAQSMGVNFGDAHYKNIMVLRDGNLASGGPNSEGGGLIDPHN